MSSVERRYLVRVRVRAGDWVRARVIVRASEGEG